MDRRELVQFLDAYLGIADVEDASLNGLQIQGARDVGRIGLAVDACMEAFTRAHEAGIDFLVVHHGLMWGRQYRLVGMHAARYRLLFAAGMNLYAAHLPLDFHAQVGNNAVLLRLAGVEDTETVEAGGGAVIAGGTLAEPADRAAFLARIEARVGPARLLGFGPDVVRRVAVVSGKAASLIPAVAACGFDTFLTGEADHSRYHEARELGINVLFAGHYATETVGLRALGTVIEERFGVPAAFVDVPTGM